MEAPHALHVSSAGRSLHLGHTSAVGGMPPRSAPGALFPEKKPVWPVKLDTRFLKVRTRDVGGAAPRATVSSSSSETSRSRRSGSESLDDVRVRGGGGVDGKPARETLGAVPSNESSEDDDVRRQRSLGARHRRERIYRFRTLRTHHLIQRRRRCETA